jgi:hypothetical protein
VEKYITLIALYCVENVNSFPFCGSLRSFWYSSLNEFFFAYNLSQFISREDRREFLACVKHQREDQGVARRANMLLLSTNGIKATGFQPVRFSVMYYNLLSHF